MASRALDQAPFAAGAQWAPATGGRRRTDTQGREHPPLLGTISGKERGELMDLLETVRVTVQRAPFPPTSGLDWYIVRFSAPDAAADKAVAALLKRLAPAHRRYQATRQEWYISRAGMEQLASPWPALREAWMRARAETAGGSEKAGDVAPTSGTDVESAAVPDPVRAAFATLHLLPSAPVPVIRAAYRALVRSAHPDVQGGDGQRMRKLNLAYERALAWAERA